MPINKIKAYQDFYLQGETTILERRDLLVEHLCNIQSEIENLQYIETYLIEKLDSYDKKHSTE